jgi:hypothetical protein
MVVISLHHLNDLNKSSNGALEDLYSSLVVHSVILLKHVVFMDDPHVWNFLKCTNERRV